MHFTDEGRHTAGACGVKGMTSAGRYNPCGELGQFARVALMGQVVSICHAAPSAKSQPSAKRSPLATVAFRQPQPSTNRSLPPNAAIRQIGLISQVASIQQIAPDRR